MSHPSEIRATVEEVRRARNGRVWESEVNLTDQYNVGISGIGQTVYVRTSPDEEEISIQFGGCRRVMSPEEAHTLGQALVEHAVDSGMDPETWEMRRRESDQEPRDRAFQEEPS